MLLSLYYLWGSLALIAIILFFVILLIFIKSKKKGKVDVDFLDGLMNSLGGCENIKGYSVENARIRIEVLDLNLVKLESLKAMSPKGVFVTGNNVKMSFKYEAKDIVHMLDQRNVKKRG